MIRIFIFLFITGMTLISCKQAKAQDNEVKTQWIKDHGIEVRTISSNDQNFSDLQPLKETLANVRIVLLGEQSHGGGTTYEAKVRLIKFLHQEMGFDIMAFESGMYDCAKIRQEMDLGKPMDQAVLNSMFYMYATSTEVKPLFHYMDSVKNTEFPMLFTGMDSQHTGQNSLTYMVDDLTDFIRKIDSFEFNEADWKVFSRKAHDIVSMNREVSKNDQKVFYRTINLLKKSLSAYPVSNEPFPNNAGFWLQIVESLESQSKRYWGDIEDMDRDRQMADNMSWLINNTYKNRKIIIWAHNFHIARGLDPQLPMGHFLKEEFKDQMYAIGFTGYDGEFDDFAADRIRKIKKPSSDSFEQAIKGTHWKYAMVDFKKSTPDGDWLQQKQKGRLMNFIQQKFILSNIFDGIFYIETTKPTIREIN